MQRTLFKIMTYCSILLFFKCQNDDFIKETDTQTLKNGIIINRISGQELKTKVPLVFKKAQSLNQLKNTNALGRLVRIDDEYEVETYEIIEISKDGITTVGLSAKNDVENPISINQNVSALKFFEDLVNPDFATYWFNSDIFLELTKRSCSIATIYYLNNDNLKLLPIPVPPIVKQLEIANHITQIRQQAQELKDKTKKVLKLANQEIENLLLN